MTTMLNKYKYELLYTFLITTYIALIGSSSFILTLWTISIPLLLLGLNCFLKFKTLPISRRNQLASIACHLIMLIVTISLHFDIGGVTTGSSTSAIALVMLPILCAAGLIALVALHWLFNFLKHKNVS